MRDFFFSESDRKHPDSRKNGSWNSYVSRNAHRHAEFPSKKRKCQNTWKKERRILPPFLPCLLAYFFSFDVFFFSLVRTGEMVWGSCFNTRAQFPPNFTCSVRDFFPCFRLPLCQGYGKGGGVGRLNINVDTTSSRSCRPPPPPNWQQQ